MPHPEIVFFFFLIAVLYSSVGFGGGSSYLALLALYGFDYEMLRLTALLCNITVVVGGTYIFYIKGFLNIKKALPLIILSIPLAFLGGRILLEESSFFVLLGFTLTFAGLLIFIRRKEIKEKSEIGENHLWMNGGIGGGIGLLSGLVGIGGGIFLSPVLHLMKWDRSKAIAATCSAFILVNSIAGILGQVSRGLPDLNWKIIAALVAAVFIGGQLGSRLGAIRFSPIVVRRMTAVLIVFVGVRILWKYLG